MIKCGLLGKKLAHSYSPQIHRYLGDYPYALIEKEPHELEDFLSNGDFSGINVTIPYKKAVLPYCDLLTPVAARLGAVNTIVRQKDGTLLGHNSDYFGFHCMLQRLELDVAGKKALVLGSGGASVTAVAVLEDLGANVTVISRTGENNYTNLQLHCDAALIVNATPVGMYPHVDAAPLTLDGFPKLEAVADLIYNPARTELLMDAQRRGLKTENGLWMLVAQAWESACFFTGASISADKISLIHSALGQQMENIVLVGMPGCGKSTVGAALADALGRPFIDADAEIEKAAGCTIPEIFEKSGEPGFRKLEVEVLSRLGKESGLVIATGGGCVTRQENYAHLHRNGTILWLQKQLDDLATEGRPLSMASNLRQMYGQRAPLYERFADLAVENDHSVSETVAAILSAMRYAI